MRNGLRRCQAGRAAWRTLGVGLVAAVGASALLVGCPHKDGPAHVSGGSFPVNNGGTLNLEDASGLSSLLYRKIFTQTTTSTGGTASSTGSTASTTTALTILPTLQSVQIGVLDVGRWGDFFLDPSPSVLLAQLFGGEYTGFGGASTNQSGTLRAISTSANERRVEMYVSALSHIAESIGVGRHLSGGGSLESTVTEGNGALGAYFSVGVDVSVPGTAGASLWDGSHTFFSGQLTPEAVVGLVTAALLQRVTSSSQVSSLDEYADLVSMDAADGVADGVVHPPFVGAVVKVTQLAGAPTDYPSDPLGGQLATDMEAFLNSSNNRSGLSVTDVQVQSLLIRLRLTAAQLIGGRQFLPKGILLGGVPVVGVGGVAVSNGVATITAPATAKSFVTGARVFFGQTVATQATVLDAGTISATVPASILGKGLTVFVTVINPDGKRHSLETTIP